jgi:hypothetical protein
MEEAMEVMEEDGDVEDSVDGVEVDTEEVMEDGVVEWEVATGNTLLRFQTSDDCVLCCVLIQ